MLALRGILFTIFVPGMVGGYIPYLFHQGSSPATGLATLGDALRAVLGWTLVAAGATIYVLCLLRFLAAGATPMIFFARAQRIFKNENRSHDYRPRYY